MPNSEMRIMDIFEMNLFKVANFRIVNYFFFPG